MRIFHPQRSIPFRVTALNTETWKLEPARVSRAFSTGVKPVHALKTALGRKVRATAKTFSDDGRQRYAAIVPPQTLHAGANRVEVFVIRGGTPKLVARTG